MNAFKSMLLVLSMLSAIAAAPVSMEEGLTKLEQQVKMLEIGQRLASLEGVHKKDVKEKIYGLHLIHGCSHLLCCYDYCSNNNVAEYGQCLDECDDHFY